MLNLKFVLISLLLVFFSGCVPGTFTLNEPIETYKINKVFKPFILYGNQKLGELNLSQTTIPDTNWVMANNYLDLNVDDYICLKDGRRFLQARITNINLNNITLDRYIDYNYSETSGCSYNNINMAVDGSTDRQIFSIKPNINNTWHIHRMILCGSDNIEGDDSTLLGAGTLNNGIFIRRSNGYYDNGFIARNIQDLKQVGFDVSRGDKAPAGEYSFCFRLTFAGDEKIGTPLEVNGNFNETLDVIIQDDLSMLSNLYVTWEGIVFESTFTN